jgi:hypothetical protein
MREALEIEKGNKNKRRMREAPEIEKRNNTLNRDDELKLSNT